MHTPVLLKEAIEGLQVLPEGKYIDATFGHGGHAREIIKGGGMVLAIDWDSESVKKYEFEDKKLKLILGNYADIETLAKENNFFPCDGIIFDLGISMGQIKESKRGFSFKALTEELDMRISNKLTIKAKDIVNSYSVSELYEILARNAQELSAKPLAESIIKGRRLKKIMTVKDLNIAIESVTHGSEAILRRVYQSLRMEVNDEVNNIKHGLLGAIELLRPGGRLSIISFNETEDRLVKQTISKQLMVVINKKPIISSSGFTFEKTAKLRVFEKLI